MMQRLMLYHGLLTQVRVREERESHHSKVLWYVLCVACFGQFDSAATLLTVIQLRSYHE